MNRSEVLKRPFKLVDDRLWRLFVGETSYLQLRPSLRKRLRITAMMPFSFFKRPPRNPIFIVGCPRSGTTVVFDMLMRSAELDSFRQESHWVWESFHPPSKRHDYAPVLEPADLTPMSSAFIRAIYCAAFGDRRFVDKCPTSCYRIGAIKALFPTAKFVFTVRNALDNVSSLIEAWQTPEKFPGFKVPLPLNIVGYERQEWVMSLMPGWQSFTQCPLEEVCAHQWITANEWILRAQHDLDAADWIEVRHEDLLEAPEQTIEKIYGDLRLAFTAEISAAASALRRRRINSLPNSAKRTWKLRNPELVERIIPVVEPLMEQLGYPTGRVYERPFTPGLASHDEHRRS